MQTLKGKIAVVAGATRGACRGIASMLGAAGATVYCTGRSVRGNPSEINRPETIEETAELVTDSGGVGVWVLVLLAYLMAEELKAHNVAVVSLTPGWLRSEKMLDGFGVTAENWQDALEQAPDFINSETPAYVGRAVVSLATDPNVMEKTGHALSAGYLAREYDFTDIDGRQPPGYCKEGTFKDGYFMPVEE